MDGKFTYKTWPLKRYRSRLRSCQGTCVAAGNLVASWKGNSTSQGIDLEEFSVKNGCWLMGSTAVAKHLSSSTALREGALGDDEVAAHSSEFAWESKDQGVADGLMPSLYQSIHFVISFFLGSETPLSGGAQSAAASSSYQQQRKLRLTENKLLNSSDKCLSALFLATHSCT